MLSILFITTLPCCASSLVHQVKFYWHHIERNGVDAHTNQARPDQAVRAVLKLILWCNSLGVKLKIGTFASLKFAFIKIEYEKQQLFYECQLVLHILSFDLYTLNWKLFLFGFIF